MFKDHFGNNITVVLGKNRLQKTPTIRTMTSFRDGRHIGLYARAIAFPPGLYKIVNLGQELTLSQYSKIAFKITL